MRLQPPDTELFLSSLLRTELKGIQNLQVDNKVPTDYRGEYPIIVLRDDGGEQTSLLTYDRSIGVTLYWSKPQNIKPVRDLARKVYAILTDDNLADMDGPIAAINRDGCNGPYTVPDEQRAATQYLTVEYSTVGESM